MIDLLKELPLYIRMKHLHAMKKQAILIEVMSYRFRKLMLTTYVA